VVDRNSLSAAPAIVGRIYAITLEARDRFDSALTHGGDTATVELARSDRARAIRSLRLVSVTDNQNGLYTISLVFPEVGIWRVHVMANGADVASGVFNVTVIEGRFAILLLIWCHGHSHLCTRSKQCPGRATGCSNRTFRRVGIAFAAVYFSACDPVRLWHRLCTRHLVYPWHVCPCVLLLLFLQCGQDRGLCVCGIQQTA
jgi:hypothetical protein